MMKELKRKHLDRREWYSDTDRDFACMYHQDEFFTGAVGLLTFTGIPAPEMVNSVRGRMCIADKGYQWLELVPENGHWALTAMFRGDTLFEQYIDITLDNEVSGDGNAVFTDLLLDVVVLRDGQPVILDEEELGAALAGGIITREQYTLAKQTAGEIVTLYTANPEQIRRKLYEYRALFQQ